jgi:hypothetical protein
MKDHLHRLVLAALAVVAVSSGAVSIFLSATNSQATGTLGAQNHVIEILHSGFNPENCTIPRYDTFSFINKTGQEQTVLSPVNEYFVVGPVPSGEVSKNQEIIFIGSNEYYLESNPDFKGFVTITDHQAEACDPLPPTPTPTNTPTPSPTPIPTPEGRKGLVPSIERD